MSRLSRVCERTPVKGCQPERILVDALPCREFEVWGYLTGTIRAIVQQSRCATVLTNEDLQLAGWCKHPLQ